MIYNPQRVKDTFVYLFEDQIDLVIERANDLTTEDKSEQAVRVFFANYKVTFDNMRDRRKHNTVVGRNE